MNKKKSSPKINRENNSSSKRKRVVISLEQRLGIVDAVEKGTGTAGMISKSYNIGTSTVYDILKQKNRISQALTERGESITNDRKTLQEARHPQMERALYMWILQQREANIILSADLIQQKAEMIHQQLIERCGDVFGEFQASKGWFQKFKKRHQLKSLALNGEKVSADVESFNKFKKSYQEFIEKQELTDEQQYNADESAIYIKMLPKTTIALKSEKSAAGRKMNKTRFTFMPCANKTGTHKLKLMFLGTAAKPRCFPENMSEFPVLYRHNKNAWMTRDLFADWFGGEFVPRVREFSLQQGIEPKAVLLLDNCSAHHFNDELKSDDNLIRCAFLPPNVTSLGQPMDQGVINAIKLRYKKRILRFLLLQNKAQQFEERVKKVSLLDSIIWLSASWDEITPLTIRNSWNQISGHEEGEVEALDDEEEDELRELLNEFPSVDEDEFNNWINDKFYDEDGNKLHMAPEMMSDDELIDYALNEQTSESDHSRDVSGFQAEEEEILDVSEAIECYDKLIQFHRVRGSIIRVAQLTSIRSELLSDQHQDAGQLLLSGEGITNSYQVGGKSLYTIDSDKRPDTNNGAGSVAKKIRLNDTESVYFDEKSAR